MSTAETRERVIVDLNEIRKRYRTTRNNGKTALKTHALVTLGELGKTCRKNGKCDDTSSLLILKDYLNGNSKLYKNIIHHRDTNVFYEYVTDYIYKKKKEAVDGWLEINSFVDLVDASKVMDIQKGDDGDDRDSNIPRILTTDILVKIMNLEENDIVLYNDNIKRRVVNYNNDINNN